MKTEIFELERIQSLWENRVEFNLTESGVHPFTVRELFSEAQIQELLDTRLGYGQTNGLIELRTAVTQLYPTSTSENILITNGSAEANFLTVWSLLEPGDELVLMLPNYMQIWGAARSFGVKVKPFYLSEDSGWAPDLDEVASLITSRTKMIAVCNPNNPTGATLSTETMDGLVDLARNPGAWLYADEIYRGAELDDGETPTFYGRYEKSLVAGGLSKAYSLPGLRIGWLAGPEEVISDIWARHDYTTISGGMLSNRLATWALDPNTRASIRRRTRSFLRDNLATLKDWTASWDDLFSWHPPKAGGIAFLQYGLEVNSTELTERLRVEHGVFIIAGDCFGMDGYIRIGIGSENAYLREGLARISAGLTAYGGFC